VRSLLPALDHFDLALGQDVGQITVQQLYDGVRIVREELGKALERQGVRVIAPKIGDEFDPNEHKAVLRQPTGEQAPNTIVSILQVGYAIDSLVLRPASVAVAATPDDDDEQE
jgi:molecular chaperone GrpE